MYAVVWLVGKVGGLSFTSVTWMTRAAVFRFPKNKIFSSSRDNEFKLQCFQQRGPKGAANQPSTVEEKTNKGTKNGKMESRINQIYKNLGSLSK